MLYGSFPGPADSGRPEVSGWDEKEGKALTFYRKVSFLGVSLEFLGMIS